MPRGINTYGELRTQHELEEEEERAHHAAMMVGKPMVPEAEPDVVPFRPNVSNGQQYANADEPPPEEGQEAEEAGTEQQRSRVTAEEVEQELERIFLRYDLDGSGAISDEDDFRQLAVNLLSILDIRIPMDLAMVEMDTLLRDRSLQRAPITQEEFGRWFAASSMCEA
jgi:hypothetical protein